MKELFLHYIYDIHFRLSLLDFWVIAINIGALIGSGLLVRWAAHNRSEKELKRRVTALRAINIVVLTTYLFAVLFNFSPGQKFAQITLTLIVAFASNHVLQVWLTHRFGAERELNGKPVMTRSYTSGMLGVVVLIFVVSLTFVAILNILDLKSWLQTTSIIGVFLLVLYATKDYFLTDIVSSLLIHYSSSLEPGNVVRLRELGILGVVQQITLTQTTLRDMIQGHEITVANSKIRNTVIENLSHSSGLIKDYIDFKLGYEVGDEIAISVLTEGWRSAATSDSGIDDKKMAVKLINCDDHSVVWRLLYSVNNPYKILEIKQHVNLMVFKKCREENIGLNTPLTHVVTQNSSAA